MAILFLNSPDITLENAGGKGMNLARLSQSGFPVPRAFIISTDAYREFVRANRWLPAMLAVADELSAADGSALERASVQIRAAFAAGQIPAETARAISAAYADFAGRPVAVRSSATAEDLPDLSFAGQQDTYLNIVGEARLLEAIISCWSSLWTARAIGYRIRNRIDQSQVALAVVVQEMVQSDASGVLFTANPVTGLRSEAVIDATLGLGEALVAGQVEPDHYVVDTMAGRITGKRLGAKQITTRSRAGGGVETVAEDAGERQALTDEQILQLAATGLQIQKDYALPQDIEWAFANGRLYVLQSRAITSLYPLPKASSDPLIVWFSFGSFQGILTAITPLGQDSIRMIAGGAARWFGAPIRYDENEIIVPAGERLWIRITDVLRNPLGFKAVRTFLAFGEPSVRQILRRLADEPHIGGGSGRLKISTIRALLGFLLPIFFRAARAMHDPENAQARFLSGLESWSGQPAISATDPFRRLAQRLRFTQTSLGDTLYILLPRFASVFAPAMLSLNVLTHLTPGGPEKESDHGFSMTALEITRGLPNNVTTEMDLALWQAAKMIRRDPVSHSTILAADAPGLAARYLDGSLPQAAQTAITGFMKRYGVRGVGEIDIGRPRWREEPTAIMQTLQSYLQIQDDMAPDVLFRQGAQAAAAATERLAGQVRESRAGWLKERIVRAAARRVRTLMGMRETPKFFMIRVMGAARAELLTSGQELAAAGLIEKPEDLFFLHFDELQALADHEVRDWKGVIAARRRVYERENLRRQIPRVLLSDGRAFYEGLGALADTDGVIHGSPVSPGIAEGNVRIVLDPAGTQLLPGEILVCRGTDPAWTPLFMSAGGLVTEVGGMMTHGSVVAREYGIPAVVGIDQATSRLKNGQRVRIDGTAGEIVLLEQS